LPAYKTTLLKLTYKEVYFNPLTAKPCHRTISYKCQGCMEVNTIHRNPQMMFKWSQVWIMWKPVLSSTLICHTWGYVMKYCMILLITSSFLHLCGFLSLWCLTSHPSQSSRSTFFGCLITEAFAGICLTDTNELFFTVILSLKM
jgi:hypothetical protein